MSKARDQLNALWVLFRDKAKDALISLAATSFVQAIVKKVEK